MPAIESPDIPELIPDPDVVRRRLAVVLTEADLLRSQLRVSQRLAKERDRLRRQHAEDGRRAD
jgi:hypothetical protein